MPKVDRSNLCNSCTITTLLTLSYPQKYRYFNSTHFSLCISHTCHDPCTYKFGTIVLHQPNGFVLFETARKHQNPGNGISWPSAITSGGCCNFWGSNIMTRVDIRGLRDGYIGPGPSFEFVWWRLRTQIYKNRSKPSSTEVKTANTCCQKLISVWHD